MSPGLRTIERRWTAGPDVDEVLLTPRRDLLVEGVCDPSASTEVYAFDQQYGPFQTYSRTLQRDGEDWIETTSYRFRLPTFGWLIALPVRWKIARRGSPPAQGATRAPWWAPPDVLNERQLTILGLLTMATIAAAYMNTLFTQSATFAADAFGVGDNALGLGGAIVRLGIVFSVPFAIAADRVGRRRILVAMATAAPIICALGALAPSFWVLVATQTLGRPLAITLDALLAVMAAEEMPANSRAYTVAVMFMWYGLGAGLSVMGLPFADLGTQGWRVVYAIALVWLVVAFVFRRSLPESIRFATPHVIAPRINRKRFAIAGSVVVLGNLFVAPASFYLNRYLSDVRGMSATAVTIFSLSFGTPAALGLVLGGKLADRRGRRLLIFVTVPISTALIVWSYAVSGAAMWFAAFIGGLIASVATPAVMVYRAELFPTGNRGRAAGWLNTAALLSGSVAIAGVGAVVDRGTSFAVAIGVCGTAQLLVVLIILFGFPESAHRELESLNDVDQPIAAPLP